VRRVSACGTTAQDVQQHEVEQATATFLTHDERLAPRQPFEGVLTGANQILRPIGAEARE